MERSVVPSGCFLCGRMTVGGHGHAQFGGQGVVEKLVVGRPPEGIVDDDGSVERGVLEIGAIEGDVVGDAVDDDGVARGLVELDGAGLDELGLNAVDIARIDVLDQRAGKAVLHAEQDADLLHTKTSRPQRGLPANQTCEQCTADRWMFSTPVEAGSGTWTGREFWTAE